MPQPASIKPESLSLALSPEEVHRLLSDNTADARCGITARIGGSYTRTELSQREILIAEQIFRLLLRDTEVRVRETLSQHIKASNSIPREIVLGLARDVEQVSLPVLEFSEVLSDNDLVELIHSTEQVARYLAITRRKHVSELVSDTLIGKGRDDVTASLVRNNGAEISLSSMERIVEDHRGNDAMMQALGARATLPVAVVDKMMASVSSALAAKLKEKYKIPSGEIEKEVEKTREKETLGLIGVARDDDDVLKLVVQLQQSGRLNPSLILSSLCQGNFEFFENSLAMLSDIPVLNARKLIADRGELGFKAIYNKSGLPEAMFPAVKLLLRVVRELDAEKEKRGTARFANRVVERILHYSEETPMENLAYIIALVRRVAQ